MSKVQERFLFAVFFLSGGISLVYQVLWLKALSNLFGNTAYAAACTLGVFFLGLSIGNACWGRCAAKIRHPLRAYAALELAVALSAGLYFWLLPFYFDLAPLAFPFLTDSPHAAIAAKCGLALGVLFLPAFFMGGTLPLMGEIIIESDSDLGRLGGLLYAVNTLGAALGAVLAGFYLPARFGFELSYQYAMALNVAIAVCCFSLVPLTKPRQSAVPASPSIDRAHRIPFGLLLVGFLSGALTLGLEVLWNQMFSQISINCVYSYSAILVSFLFALALGALLGQQIAQTKLRADRTLRGLLILAGVLTAFTPNLFFEQTAGLQTLQNQDSWFHYMTAIFSLASVVIILPCTVMGAVFPYLLRIAQGTDRSPGSMLGTLTAANTAGAIVGSVAAGFFLLEAFGIWQSITLLAFAYAFLALVPLRIYKPDRNTSFLAGLACVLIAGLFSVRALPTVHTNRAINETVMQTWHGAYGTLAVLSARPHSPNAGGGRDIYMKLNNSYTLGGRGALYSEQRQGLLPMFLHRDPKSVFHLGLATGISAGAALAYPLERLVVAEVVDDVTEAAEKFFGNFNNGLFTDERVTIVQEDGRTYLRSSGARYDIINADLFRPWGQSIGNLYARETFELYSSRLHDDGLFVQWLPLYQLSPGQFTVIARTLLEIFPQVTLWRGNFDPNKPIVALVGHKQARALDPARFVRNMERFSVSSQNNDLIIDLLVHTRRNGLHTVSHQEEQFFNGIRQHIVKSFGFTFYLGNISENKSLFLRGPVNTYDRPIIEFATPKMLLNSNGGTSTWLYRLRLARFVALLRKKVPLHADPYLKQLSARQLRYVSAGQNYYEFAARQFENRRRPTPVNKQLAARSFRNYLKHIGLQQAPR